MASGTDNSLERSPATGLGAIRALLHGIFLAIVLHDSFSAIAQLPATLFRPPGVMEYISWKFYDRLLTPQGMIVFKLMLLFSLFLSTTGWWTRVSVKSSALLVILYEGLLRGFGNYGHNEMAAVTALVVLAIVPCGDAFSVDAICGPPVRRPRAAYRYPISLIKAILAWAYVSNAALILRTAGWRFFDVDNMPAMFVSRSLGNMGDGHFSAAFDILPYRHYVPPVLMLVIAWQILFPVGYYWRRTRYWFLAFGVLYHVVMFQLTNQFHYVQMLTLVVFLDWVAIGSRISRLAGIRSIVAWWDEFSSTPEFFPDVRMAPPLQGGLLLWDGQCGFCKRMVTVIQKMSLRPISSQPYQERIADLPSEVLPWTNRQMHWIRVDGSIVGGSQSLIEVLEASYHNLLSGLLECRLLRPFTWIGYRLVARHRATAGDLIGASCELPNQDKIEDQESKGKNQK